MLCLPCRLGQPLLSPDNDDTDDLMSHSFSVNKDNMLTAETTRFSNPNPVTVSQRKDTTTSSQNTLQNESVSIRARPRPSSAGRSVSPASLSLRRSGFIASTNDEQLSLNSHRPSSPWRADNASPSADTQATWTSQANRDCDTLWESFENSLCKPPEVPVTSQPSTNPFSNDFFTDLTSNIPFTSTVSTTSSTLNSLDVLTVPSSTGNPFSGTELLEVRCSLFYYFCA